MRLPSLDPTAGETARATHLHPEADHEVTDPTDPRYGRLPLEAEEDAGRAGPIVDPTDPASATRSG